MANTNTSKKLNCPDCGEIMRRSRRKGVIDNFVYMTGFVPYRCNNQYCEKRLYKPRKRDKEGGAYNLDLPLAIVSTPSLSKSKASPGKTLIFSKGQLCNDLSASWCCFI